MKDAVEAIDRLLSHLGTLLRYVAPGFAALYVVAAVIQRSRSFLLSSSPAVVVLGMLLGPAIYAVHTGALLRLWVFLIIIWHHEEYQMTDLFKKKRRKLIWEQLSKLDDERWLRRATKEPEVQSIQAEMNRWSALNHLLYCLSYMMILIPLTAWIHPLYTAENFWEMLLGGCFIFVVVVISDYRNAVKESELTTRYPGGIRPNQAMDPSGNRGPASG